MIAIIEGYRSGVLARSQWAGNLIAGVIVGVVALPLAMAFAIASGARPEQGIYTAIIGGALVTLFGGSRVQIAGPTGAFIAILAGVTAKYGIAGLQVATFMAGVMLLVMGLTRFGGVIRFIPSPVIVGFTAGIGVVIFVGQWPDFFGLPKPGGEAFHLKLWHTLQAFHGVHLPTLGLSLFTLLLVIYAPRIKGLTRVPGPLTAMLAATVLQSLLQFPGIATIGSAFGGIPQGLPAFALPDLSAAEVTLLVGPAFTIAMLGAIESLLSAVVADGMTGTRHDSNQELVGQGIANIIVPLFGGFAATGAIARTATNIRNGGTGPLAGIVHALTLVAVLLVLAPLAARIPLAALAAILFVVAWNMSDVKHVVHMLRRAPNADRVILCVTFLLTVFADLVVAVNVGVILAVLQFVRRMSESTEVEAVSASDATAHFKANGIEHPPEGVIIYEVAGPVFFGAIENFERGLLQSLAGHSVLILRLRRVPFVDISGIQVIESVSQELRQRGIDIILCEANERVLAKLVNAGVIANAQDLGYARGLDDALRQAHERVRRNDTSTEDEI